MKSVLIILISFFICFEMSGQKKTIANSYSIKNNKEDAKAEFYKKAIENSNMEAYRLRSETATIEFENGFTLELASAKSLEGSGINILDYAEKSNLSETKPVFRINDSGVIMVMYTTKETKSK